MKILVVEDNPPSRELVYSLLKLEGYDVITAVDGKEGLDFYEKHKPDLIVSDIEMPFMDGLTLLRNLREKKSDVFFIITTAYGSEEYAMEALRNGSNNYLKKPIDTKLLLQIVAKYANIIRNRQFTAKAEGRIIAKNLKLEFDTDYSHIPVIVNRLISEISLDIDVDIKTNIEIGLSELITNAIEHGNLGITYDEKVQATNSNSLFDLYDQRMQNPELSSRVVTIDYKQNLDSVEWTIEDQGSGFNWQELPDPTKGAQLLELSGRGIFLTRFSFEELEYSGKGNIVRIKKILQKEDN